MSYRAIFLLGILAGIGWQVANYYGYFASTPAARESTPSEAPTAGPEAAGRPAKAAPSVAPSSRRPAAVRPATPEEVSRELRGWSVERDHGRSYPKKVAKLGLKYPSARTNLLEASQEFLDRYAGALYGIDREQFAVRTLRPASADSDFMKVVYEQEIDGIPVINSRLALFYLGDGTLFEVHANVVPTDRSVATAQTMSAREAAGLAYGALERLYRAQNLAVPPALAPENLAAKGKFALYLSGNGDVSSVYQFLLPLPGLTGPQAGEREIVVDVSLRQVAIDRKLARN